MQRTFLRDELNRFIRGPNRPFWLSWNCDIAFCLLLPLHLYLSLSSHVTLALQGTKRNLYYPIKIIYILLLLFISWFLNYCLHLPLNIRGDYVREYKLKDLNFLS